MVPVIRSIVTLKSGQEADKVLYITEAPEYVRAAAEAGGYVMMTRIRGMGLAEFTTQASNILNIESYDAS